MSSVAAPEDLAVGITLRVADRVEALLDPLVDRLRAGLPDDPFTPVTIMVFSRGMQRWLSHQLAERLDPAGRGIATTLGFPFPGKVVSSIVAACHAGADDDPWARERLVWPILEVLRDQAQRDRPDPAFARLRRYLGSAEVVDRRAWRFSDRVADVFDRYALHRPRMVAAWAAGRDVDEDDRSLDDHDLWQPRLWRRLVEELDDPTDRLATAITRLREDDALDLTGLPAPLLTFGISALPPRQLDLLAAYGQRREVELYIPTASTARWEAIHAARTVGHARPSPRHPLLVSCGELLDDAAELLTATAPPALRDDAATGSESDDGDLLAHLQGAIRRDEAPRPSLHLDVVDGVATDPSVQVHACHGPARQAEVLRDVLLGILAEDPTLQLRDVLIVTPDIDRYAPLITAAFAGTDEVPELPVTVADRHIGRTNPVADALLAALALGARRVTASEVLDLLGREVVLHRFGLDLTDLARVAGWVQATGIRWGIDDEHRSRAGQPADRAHTWRAGLDRLLLGAAMADEGQRVVGDVTPFDDVEGHDVEVVGRVAEACSVLFEAVALAREPIDLHGWIGRCEELLRDLIGVPATDRWQVQEVRGALEELADRTAGTPPLDLAAAQSVIEGAVAAPRGAAGYETGAATLCALVPMRSIPHRVVCLLGLDDGALPRSTDRLGFDLQDRAPRLGDRDRRQEDRSLFLEAVLSARQHLVVTTSGYDVRTGEERPPAVPLAELLDTLDATATTADGSSVGRRITRTHPLQAFSPRNFGDDGHGGTVAPFGFDPVARDAAERLRRPRDPALPLVPEPLPPPTVDLDDADAAPEGDPTVVRLEDLTEAVLHPTRFLLVRRLGIGLREFTVELDDLEPVDLDPLTRSQLGRALLRSPDGLADTAAWQRAVLASGVVPAGTPGTVRLAELGDDVSRLLDAALTHVEVDDDPAALASLADGGRSHLDVQLAGRRLVGEVDGCHPAGGGAVQLWLSYTRPRPEHLLRAWVAHLALTVAGQTALDTWIVTRGAKDAPEQRHLAPLAEDPNEAMGRATALLAPLLEVHDRAWCELLPLFPRASSTFADGGGLRAARSAFEPKPFVLGDVGDRDDAVVHAYGDDVSLDVVLATEGRRDDFARLARLVWGPALAHQAGDDR